MISVASLVTAGIGPTQARMFEKPLLQTCEQFDIKTPERQAYFFGQYAYETGGFIHLEENLLYRDPIRIVRIFRGVFKAEIAAALATARAVAVAGTTEDELLAAAYESVSESKAAKALAGNPQGMANRVYANRNGNGSEASGDGWRFRGRGLCMLTGKANYALAAADLKEPYIEHPEFVADPADACLVGGWYWNRNRCNVLADRGAIDDITRVVNGPGMVGSKERRDLSRRALQAFR